MLSRYLAWSLRLFRRTPFALAVNVLTLAAGLFCFLVAYAVVEFWSSAERYFPNADRTYVLTTTASAREGNFSIDADTMGATRLAEQIRIDFPELERVARATLLGRDLIASSGAETVRLYTVAADPELLEIFAMPFLGGDELRALDTPRSVVLTRQAAQELFGDDDPIGRIVRLDNRVEVSVTGVIDAVPEPSHFGRSTAASLPFELLASHDVRDALVPAPENPEATGWMNSESITYLLVPRDRTLTAATIAARLVGFAERHIPADDLRQGGFDIEFGVIPVTTVLRKSVDESLFVFPTTTVSLATVLLALGSLVLVVACVNYANLATASAVTRVRDAGVHKVLGATPLQIMARHLLEAAALTVAALLAALLTFRVAAPQIADMVGADPWRTLFADVGVWGFLLLVIVSVTAASGAYPAFIIARVLPMSAIRGSIRIAPRRLAATLVSIQFTVASFLLIAVTVTWLQNAELRQTGLDSIQEPLIALANPDGPNGVDRETLRAELLRIPEIRGVTDIDNEPWIEGGAMLLRATPDPASPLELVMRRSVGRDFFGVFDIEIVAGRGLNADRAEDERVFSADRPTNVVVDRAFVERFDLGTPDTAIDKLVYFPVPDGRVLPFRIVGVAEDVRWSLSRIGDARATMYVVAPGNPIMVVRIAADGVADALRRIDALWEDLSPNVPIERRFLDDIFEQAYTTFVRINEVFTALAVIAFVISAAGLFGIAALVIGRRTREVAVRKTLGARTSGVLAMLLGSFATPVVVANLVAWPVGYLAARAYLDLFVSSIALTPLPFVFCLAVTLAIACAAVAAHTLRGARAKPADALRTE